ncbi:hypothetical protein [Alkalihalobacillus pseudalcaliphilus]|uniref:hypothetical protein n=1 Tax=Alkalihalobacillus pseudalcaliphilus TaxID=79884 RepID=UPI000B2C9AFC|nr:hypothetical protein [Alkalihalobacillus pseudalcaliphilus]
MGQLLDAYENKRQQLIFKMKDKVDADLVHMSLTELVREWRMYQKQRKSIRG